MEKYGSVGQTTDSDITRHMRFASWITGYNHTLRVCDTHLLFHCDSGYMNEPQCYVIRTLSALCSVTEEGFCQCCHSSSLKLFNNVDTIL